MRPLILIPALLCATLFSTTLGWRLSNTSTGRQTAVTKKIEKAAAPAPDRNVPVATGSASFATSSASLSDEPVAAGTEEQPGISLLQQRATALKQATTVEECRQLSRALATMGGEDAADAMWLAAAAQEDPTLREAILEGFDSVTDPAMITFSASVLKATNASDILNAAGKLISRGADSDTVSFLSQLYHESDTTETQRNDIEESLRLIRNEPAIPVLGLLARSSEQPRLAYSAILALSALGTPAAMSELKEVQAALESKPQGAPELVASIVELTSTSSL